MLIEDVPFFPAGYIQWSLDFCLAWILLFSDLLYRVLYSHFSRQISFALECREISSVLFHIFFSRSKCRSISICIIMVCNLSCWQSSGDKLHDKFAETSSVLIDCDRLCYGVLISFGNELEFFFPCIVVWKSYKTSSRLSSQISLVFEWREISSILDQISLSLEVWIYINLRFL